MPEITPVVDEGLGNSAYLVELADGGLLAIDPCLDLRSLRAAARGRPVRFVAETHLHADFLSASRQLAAEDGAAAIAAGGRAFEHIGLSDGDAMDLGSLTLTPIATPGHTFEHVSYALTRDDDVLAVFTGGSLIVGGAARTDLLGAEHQLTLARAQFASLRRLALFPDETPIYPTHGAGSFCSAAGSKRRTTTVGDEKANNPLLAAPDEEAFVARLLAGLGSYPRYFDWLPEVNRLGAPFLAERPLRQVAPDEARGATIVDVRPVDDYAQWHIPGSISIALRPAFASWLGWLVERDEPIVALRNSDQDAREIQAQAAKIGYAFAGEVDIRQWRGLRSTPTVDASDADPAIVIDVRQRSESEAQPLIGARNIEVAQLDKAELGIGPVVTMCARGERAATAASLLERRGRADVTIALGGPR